MRIIISREELSELITMIVLCDAGPEEWLNVLGQPRPSRPLRLAMESLPGSLVDAHVAAVQFGDAGEELLAQSAAGRAAEAEGAARDGVVQGREPLQLQLPVGALPPLALRGWVAGCEIIGASCVPSLQRKGFENNQQN